MFDTEYVHGYHIGELIRNDSHTCTYHVTDGSKDLVLKVVTEGMCVPSSIQINKPVQRNNSTEWRSTLVDSFKYRNKEGQDMHCFVYKEDKEDYFSVYECSSIAKKKVKYDALNTPTPYGGMQPAAIECNDDDGEDEDDEDDDSDGDEYNDSESESESESESDSDSDDVEVNIIVNEDKNVAPILHKECSQEEVQREHIHFANNPLLAKMCHRQHRPIVRTPVPQGNITGVPNDFNQQNLTCQKDQFKLEMLQSSMLKRRSTSSAGHLA